MKPEYTTAHAQSIVTPARTGGKIGNNRRIPPRPQWGSVWAAMLAIAGLAAALGLVAGSLLNR